MALNDKCIVINHICIKILRNEDNLSLFKCMTIMLRPLAIYTHNLMSLFVFFISLLIVAQHVSGNHVPIIRSWRLRDVIALCWYVPWLQEGCDTNPSMDALPANRTWQPSLQPRHIPARGYNIMQSSAPDDGHMVARNMLTKTIRREIKNTKSDI